MFMCVCIHVCMYIKESFSQDYGSLKVPQSGHMIESKSNGLKARVADTSTPSLRGGDETICPETTCCSPSRKHRSFPALSAFCLIQEPGSCDAYSHKGISLPLLGL